MAKLKSPVLALGATGTIAESLTFQRTHKTDWVREKPIPTYRRTLPQVYQRWLYHDYAYLWRQQDHDTKLYYASLGYRHHLTGYQAWMKYHLTHLPDILGGWHLDHGLPGKAIDFSRNLNHGTIYGTSLTDGLIDHALSFDGIDDLVAVPPSPSLNAIDDVFSIAFFLRKTANTGIGGILGKAAYKLYIVTDAIATTTGHIRFIIEGSFDDWLLRPLYVITADTWAHLVFTYDGTTAQCFKDGALFTTNVEAGRSAKSTTLATIGSFATGAHYLTGTIDHLAIYNRVLDPTEIKTHSERRYP